MENNLVELVKGINLSSAPITAIKFSGYGNKVSAKSSDTDCCYGADCGDCQDGEGYCIDAECE